MIEWFELNVAEAARPYVLLIGALFIGGLIGYLVAATLLSTVRRLGARAAKRSAEARAAERAAAGEDVPTDDDSDLTASSVAESIHRNLAKPIRWAGGVLGALILVTLVDDYIVGANLYYVVEKILEVALYGIGAWLVVEAVEVIGDVVLARYRYAGQVDNFAQRKAYTQLLYIKRVVMFLAVVIAIALTLFQFERVRELGTGLLASAGVAGIIIGVAAQKSLANLLAGFQIAFTQPLRIDDAVIFQGEFGRVEEITLTYVVLRIWDDRRMVVPLGKFIDEPFQNWTRASTEITGVVLLYLDYGADLSAVRAEVDRICTDNPLWDGRAKNVQVTDASEQTMTVRIIVTARNSGDAFGLRCQLREGVLTYLRENQPDALPLRRVGTPRGETPGEGLQAAGAASEPAAARN